MSLPLSLLLCCDYLVINSPTCEFQSFDGALPVRMLVFVNVTICYYLLLLLLLYGMIGYVWLRRCQVHLSKSMLVDNRDLSFREGDVLRQCACRANRSVPAGVASD